MFTFFPGLLQTYYLVNDQSSKYLLLFGRVIDNPKNLVINTSRSLLDFLATMGLTGKWQALLSGETLDLGQQRVKKCLQILTLGFCRQMSRPWVLWIEGRLGSSYLSDIGIDSLALEDGER